MLMMCVLSGSPSIHWIGVFAKSNLTWRALIR
ncbi:hypothetical protein BURPSS13_C0046 [Burkholderia pseudomallei S13]|nr:hypothetical protein BURPSS13_C0046 [Burkholderia pseudomallei S13]